MKLTPNYDQRCEFSPSLPGSGAEPSLPGSGAEPSLPDPSVADRTFTGGSGADPSLPDPELSILCRIRSRSFLCRNPEALTEKNLLCWIRSRAFFIGSGAEPSLLDPEPSLLCRNLEPSLLYWIRSRAFLCRNPDKRTGSEPCINII